MSMPLVAQKLIAYLLDTGLPTRRGILSRLFESLDRRELPIVRTQAAAAQKSGLRPITIAINYLGNGLLFFVCGALVLLFQGREALPVVGTALLALGIAHAIYPAVKSYVARPRPMDRDPTLDPMLAPLDRFSCPSGHCMTATAVFIPIIYYKPSLFYLLGPLWLLIAWARVAAAHHYPSDLLVGALIGWLVAWPLTILCLS